MTSDLDTGFDALYDSCLFSSLLHAFLHGIAFWSKQKGLAPYPISPYMLLHTNKLHVDSVQIFGAGTFGSGFASVFSCGLAVFSFQLPNPRQLRLHAQVQGCRASEQLKSHSTKTKKQALQAKLSCSSSQNRVHALPLPCYNCCRPPFGRRQAMPDKMTQMATNLFSNIFSKPQA